jgi:hypothetical protein
MRRCQQGRSPRCHSRRRSPRSRRSPALLLHPRFVTMAKDRRPPRIPRHHVLHVSNARSLRVPCRPVYAAKRQEAGPSAASRSVCKSGAALRARMSPALHREDGLGTMCSVRVESGRRRRRIGAVRRAPRPCYATVVAGPRLGLATGLIGVASIVAVMHDGAYAFGLLQIVWFAWSASCSSHTRTSMPGPVDRQQVPCAV